MRQCKKKKNIVEPDRPQMTV